MTSQSLPANASLASNGLLTRLFATTPNLSPLALRLALAVTMFPHGAQKALGWFGGYGWSGTMGFLTGQIGMPGFAAAGVILLELLGPLLLLAGLATRAVALGFTLLMLGAIVTVHAQYGFFMNWFGVQQGEGIEYHLLVIGIALALVFAGGGRWSLDGKLAMRSAS
ncbi:MAG: DoxX family protein [Planctomycetes bacterium]|nr:DoxX family protein [Planctomycetota bacterium]